MHPINRITAKQENFRIENCIIRRDSIEPEPVGTIVLMAFRITGYDKDCDGSLMARLEHINKDGKTSGWNVNCIGLYSDSELVVTQSELQSLFKNPTK